MTPAAASPHVIVVAGPNGAGKSTSAPALLRDTLRVDEFVNADVIAAGLSAFRPEAAAITAGRVMVRRMEGLAASHRSFAFETTLASRSFAPWIARLASHAYRTHLVFLWLRSADLAVERVAERVRLGGHHVPEETIRRRYESGLRNLFALYLPIVGSWQVFDNSSVDQLRLIAAGSKTEPTRAMDPHLWREIEEAYRARR